MDNRTWIRVEDESGQFDHDKSRPLPPGVKPVEGYPEHYGPLAREPKPRTDKTGAPTTRVVTEPALKPAQPRKRD